MKHVVNVHAAIPYLCVRGAEEALKFYENAYCASVNARFSLLMNFRAMASKARRLWAHARVPSS